MAPEWFLANAGRYDSYGRDSVPAFLGEYAAKANNMEAALAEAAYMTGLERNGDIVSFACYAPLFGNGKSNQWMPDMVFFCNGSVYGTINYYVQKLFMNHQGTYTLDSTLSGETDDVYQVSSLGEGSIILKLVNVTGSDVPLSVSLSGASVSSGTAAALKNDFLEELNPSRIRSTSFLRRNPSMYPITLAMCCRNIQ